jgi:uncharacterized protein YdhG (YjbR/CyaY superfamily)
MAMNSNIAPDIDTYIAAFPPAVQKQLNIMRRTIRKAAPAATETIKYAIPTFVLNGNLVHFAAYTNHIGFYPAPVGIEAFEDELSVYKQGKGSVQFPIDEPLPLELVSKIVEYRVKQQEVKIKKSPSSRSNERG